MPSFQCPHCGTTTEIDDRYVGKTGECVACARPISVPELVEAQSSRSPTDRPAWLTFALISAALTLFGLALFALSVWVIRPTLRQSMLSARTQRASDQAEQIMAALYAYEADNGRLPPAYTVDENGKKLHSWRTLILPYLGPEAQAVYDQIQLDEPWDSPTNARWSQYQLFLTLDDKPFGMGDTSWCVVTNPRFAFNKSRGRKLSELADPPDSLLMVIEVRSSGINWMEPRDVDIQQLMMGLNAGGRGICGSFRSNRAAVGGFMDGKSRLISEDTPPATLQEMATIAGGESPTPVFED